jgi:hypothetical protein
MKVAYVGDKIPSWCRAARNAGFANHFWVFPTDRFELLANSRIQVCLLCGWCRRVSYSETAPTRKRNFGREVARAAIGFKITATEAQEIWGKPSEWGYDPRNFDEKGNMVAKAAKIPACRGGKHDFPTLNLGGAAQAAPFVNSHGMVVAPHLPQQVTRVIYCKRCSRAKKVTA